MTRNLINRRTVGALTAAVALGIAGPAAARTDLVGPVVIEPPIVHHETANVLPPFTGAKVPYYGKANVLPPFAPGNMKPSPQATVAPVTTATPRVVINHPAAGGASDLVYILVGGLTGAVAGIGGANVVSRRRSTSGGGTSAPPRSRIAA
jgi:hypothetical protein